MERLFKVIIIGDPTVGKTSFVHRYVHNAFRRDYKGTIGVDFALKVVHWSSDLDLKLQLWDIAGQERFTSMTRVYYKDTSACVIMFDITQRSSFLNALRWKNDLDSKCTLTDGSRVPCILLANKCDLDDLREVEQDEIEKLTNDEGFIGWTEISVKEGLMVEDSMQYLLDKLMESSGSFEDSESDDPDIIKFNVTSDSLDTSDSGRRGCAC